MNFLDFPFKGIKASYAPSAGGIDRFGEYEERVKNVLSDFDYISIRDNNTERLVKALIDKPFSRVYDPTFLHDFEDLTTVDSLLHEPYILIFGNLLTQFYKRSERNERVSCYS